jgi:hypothetical protein
MFAAGGKVGVPQACRLFQAGMNASPFRPLPGATDLLLVSIERFFDERHKSAGLRADAPPDRENRP